MGARPIDEIRAELEDAVLQIQNLTTLLDESMEASQEEKIVEELQRARALVISLERELAEAEAR